MSGGRIRRKALALALVVATTTSILGGCSSSDSGGSSGDGPPRTTVPPAPTPVRDLTRLSVAKAGDRRYVADADGREVILRGANHNGLGDYFQGDPELAPTQPPTTADWKAMAEHGFSVVRLIVSWSKFEPTRGAFDQAYLAQVRAAVANAAAHGIYSVIDFHQDAWGKYIASPDGTTCPDGHEPAIGWDGAPKWATITDGKTTCRPKGNREGAPAVQAAFTNFYENTDGIRDAYVATVAKVAAAFATDPHVAGYDLMNEPNKVLPDDESTTAFTAFNVAAVKAIRAAEGKVAKGFPHLLFLEPIVLFPLPGTQTEPGSLDDPNIVFAPHNYGSVLTQLITADAMAGVSLSTAKERGWALWYGEYGIFDPAEENLAILREDAKLEDQQLVGSAEWQWRQHCGDPHTVATVGGHFTGVQYHLLTTTCPADTAKPTTAFLDIVGRAYARAAPGHLTKVESDPTTGTLTAEGDATSADVAHHAPLVVWVPGDKRPTAHPTGMAAPKIAQVDGGWYITSQVAAGHYRLNIARS